MKGNIRVVVFGLVVAYLFGCVQSTPAPTLPATSTIKPSPVPSSTATHTPEPTVTPTETLIPKLELPKWINEPGIDILLTIGVSKNGFRITTHNAETGDGYEFSQLLDIGAIFWMPDGNQIGYITIHSPNIHLINLQTGEIDEHPPGENTYTHVFPPDSETYLYEPFLLTTRGSSEIDDDFVLAFEGRSRFFYRGSAVNNEVYSAFISDEIDKNHIFYIQDVLTEDILEIEFPVDEAARPSAELGFSFVPERNLLLVRNKDENTLGIYNASTGQQTSFFMDVTRYIWAPDGQHIVYDPQGYDWIGQGSTTIYDNESVPCMLNVVDNVKHCPSQIRDQFSEYIDTFQWSPDGSKLGLSGSGEICYYDLASRKVECPTVSILELDERNMDILAFSWSPDGEFISFNYDRSCWYCDYRKEPMGGIVQTDGSEYVLIGYIFDSFTPGLWRPNVSP